MLIEIIANKLNVFSNKPYNHFVTVYQKWTQMQTQNQAKKKVSFNDELMSKAGQSKMKVQGKKNTDKSQVQFEICQSDFAFTFTNNVSC